MGKVLIWEKVLIFGSRGFCILGIVYTVWTQALKLDLLFISFKKKGRSKKRLSLLN